MRARYRCEACDRPLKAGNSKPCVRGCGARLCRRPHLPRCSDLHGGQCVNCPIPDEDHDMSNPDQPYDPNASAARTLRELGYTPGPQPIRQLRQVAAETLADIELSASTEPERSGETAETHTRLLEAAFEALGVLTENDLDQMEQQHLAKAFGLPEPGGDRE